jgi:hypothetical protein
MQVLGPRDTAYGSTGVAGDAAASLLRPTYLSVSLNQAMAKELEKIVGGADKLPL